MSYWWVSILIVVAVVIEATSLWLDYRSEKREFGNFRERLRRHAEERRKIRGGR